MNPPSLQLESLSSPGFALAAGKNGNENEMENETRIVLWSVLLLATIIQPPTAAALDVLLGPLVHSSSSLELAESLRTNSSYWENVEIKKDAWKPSLDIIRSMDCYIIDCDRVHE